MPVRAQKWRQQLLHKLTADNLTARGVAQQVWIDRLVLQTDKFEMRRQLIYIKVMAGGKAHGTTKNDASTVRGPRLSIHAPQSKRPFAVIQRSCKSGLLYSSQ
jgi:hypothetical protein